MFLDALTVAGRHMIAKAIETKSVDDAKMAVKFGSTVLTKGDEFEAIRELSAKTRDRLMLPYQTVEAAVNANDLDAVFAYISTCATEEKENEGVLSSMCFAVMYGKIEIVKKLLPRVPPTSVDAIVTIATDRYTVENYGEILEMLVSKSTIEREHIMGWQLCELCPVFLTDDDYYTTVKYLLENGANVHGVYESETVGFSALVNAATYGISSVIDALIEKGADVHQANCDGFNCLWYAVNGMVMMHQSRPPSGDDLLEEFARWQGYISCIERLLEAGVDPHRKPVDNWSTTAERVLDYASSLFEVGDEILPLYEMIRDISDAMLDMRD